MTEDKLRTELEPLVAQAIFGEHYYAYEEPTRGHLAEQHPDDVERAMRQARAALEVAGVEGLLLRIESLTSENATLRDLLETAYRKTDEARGESDKADDEALHWKTVAAREDVSLSRRNYAAIKAWQARAEKAEAALKALSQ